MDFSGKCCFMFWEGLRVSRVEHDVHTMRTSGVHKNIKHLQDDGDETWISVDLSLRSCLRTVLALFLTVELRIRRKWLSKLTREQRRTRTCRVGYVQVAASGRLYQITSWIRNWGKHPLAAAGSLPIHLNLKKNTFPTKHIFSRCSKTIAKKHSLTLAKTGKNTHSQPPAAYPSISTWKKTPFQQNIFFQDVHWKRRRVIRHKPFIKRTSLTLRRRVS